MEAPPSTPLKRERQPSFLARARGASLAHAKIADEYIKLEQGRSDAAVQMHTGWVLSFVEPTTEFEYALEMDSRRNAKYIMEAAGINIAASVALLVMTANDMQKYTGPDNRFLLVCGILQFMTSFIAIGASNVGVLNETIVISWAFATVVLNILTSPWRASVFYGGDGFELYSGAACDSAILLIMALIGVGVHFFFDVRTSRSMIVPLGTVLSYGALSIPPSMAPEGSFQAIQFTVLLAVIGYVTWIGRYAIEKHDRAKWAETRSLKEQVDKQELHIKQEEKKMAKMKKQMDDMEATLASMEKLEPSNRRVRVDSMEQSTSRSHLAVSRPPKPSPVKELVGIPNPLLVSALKGQCADFAVIKRMATKITSPGYSLSAFFNDAKLAFPELNLFFATDDCKTSSGRSGEVEYQRTIGALFCVYWLMRLDGDGENGFSYGVDVEGNWEVITSPNHRRKKSDGSDDEPPSPSTAKFFHTMSDEEKRFAFKNTMKWNEFSDLVTMAGCHTNDEDGIARTMALLCLTSFHDVFKVEDLLPTCQAEHAPYMGYQEGEIIRDHDVALSYVLIYYEECIPSFQGLPDAAKKAILFTQSKLQFNHGWFVQAEAPPGAMLSTFKRMLSSGGCSSDDVALYFLHWLTDLSGAEATPLGGAEKFVLRFPHHVLSSFLWSIPFLRKLVQADETEVVEEYLTARWKMAHDAGPPVPKGPEAVALLRLSAMTQGNSEVLEAFSCLSEPERLFLGDEMARTGCASQTFRLSPVRGGPAILIYYGPALLQRHMGHKVKTKMAMASLCEVYRAARALWPVETTYNVEDGGAAEGAEEVKESDEAGPMVVAATDLSRPASVTIEIAQLKARIIDDIFMPSYEVRDAWVLVKKNATEAVVELRPTADINKFNADGTTYHVLDFRYILEAKEGEKKVAIEDNGGRVIAVPGRANSKVVD
mmetsp:Transcript_45311/g.124738  ORF Transcript_45311/g.124738 Transcript_45311/m.124738 type:complete len:937 (-) Transcript_45311:37-2847(-)|eukprot:CAMPEP_0119543296 /NCGR_PEP_ID=MMETSP1344-20130328/54042_1 /TAXON_ID=236787 /ORGANISM="Florenciella parvula, Strain CCMP2471" /LENGTH=936 /DNA_ID=CAMNT_0007587579 /DNA_START=513 /DNA_END=3326 /DNA_ORIENTATION=-